MLREIVWITFAALVLFTPPAKALHEVAPASMGFCILLGQYLYPEVRFAKTVEGRKDLFVAYTKDWMLEQSAGPELVEHTLEAVSVMWDAEDHGEALVLACVEKYSEPEPSKKPSF